MPKLLEMFSDVESPAQLSGRVTEFQAALDRSQETVLKGNVGWDPNSKTITKGINSPRGAAKADEILSRLDTITKAAGPGAGVSVTDADIEQLRALVSESNGNIRKDWTPTSPVSLAPYDLEGPAKLLVPHETPLRNSIPRTSGQGTARTFRAITSYTNDGLTGGAGVLTPFFNSQASSVAFGGPGNVNLNRPPKIATEGAEYTYKYVEQGFSDQVNWITQFQALGFDNPLSLSHTALLWSTMLGEERAMLYGRGATTGGYSGIVAAPSTITTGTATTGGSLAALTYYVYVAAVTGFGQSAVSTVASQVTTGTTSTLTVNVGTEPTGALYYNLYVGTTTGIANAHLQTAFSGNTVTITAYSAAATPIAGTDSSFDANAYDGMLTVATDPARSGYFLRLNAALSSSAPGSEIDAALVSMWTANRATPDEIWLTGRAQAFMSQSMRNGGASGYGSGYRTNLQTGSDVIMGTIVTGTMNPVSGTLTRLRAHPFMPSGTLLMRSTSLPIPASGVPAPVAVVNVQEYMALDWPVIQMTYDASTYLNGTLLHYAPAWHGAIVGITNG